MLEIERNCTASLNGFFNSIDFMDTDVVHNHDVASLQGRNENLFGIGLEHLAGHRPFEHKRRGNTIMTELKCWLLFLQDLTCGGDVRPVLLGGPQII
jgi:hypothetical protein